MRREFGGTSQTPLRMDLTYTADHQLDTATRYLDLAGATRARFSCGAGGICIV